MSGRSSALTSAAIVATRPSSTHHTAVDTGSAGLRSVSALITIASAAHTATSSSTTPGPNVFHASRSPAGP